MHTQPDPLGAAVQQQLAERVAEAVAAERVRIAALLRFAAAGRREYAVNAPDGESRRVLELQAVTIESAARVVEGDLGPLYGWLPSWRWTYEMTAALNCGDTPGAVEGRSA